MSTVQLQNIAHTNGTTAATIDSNGVVTMANTVMYDTYRVTSNVTSNGVITAWEKPDDDLATTVGDSMSVSSGIFTFPRTGIYKVVLMASIENQSTDSLTVAYIKGTTDNSTYSNLSLGILGSNGSDIEYGTVYAEAVVNISDVSNRKIRIDAGSITSPSYVYGDTSDNRTYVSFQYLAPST